MAQISRRRMILAAGAATLAPRVAVGQSDPTAAPGCWRRGPDLPFPVQEIYPCIHDGRIFIAGGLTGDSGRATRASERVVSLALTEGAVRSEAGLATPSHHAQLVSCAGDLWMIGGFLSEAAGISWTMSAGCARLDGGARQWVPGPEAPSPNAECVAASVDDRIHLIGGRRPKGLANVSYGDHADSGGHLVFSPRAQRWSHARPAPTARNSAAGGRIGGALHIVGGRTMSGGPTSAHEVYDIGEDRWRTAAPLPEEATAGGLAAVSDGGRLFVFGGEIFDPRPGRVLDTVRIYDSGTDRWETAPAMPESRHGLGAVVAGGVILTLGGAASPGGVGASAATRIFDPACAKRG
jgi:hypothetical protein